MKVSINQPAYLPWLGYFDRVASSDVAIVLDSVMIEKGSYTNRNRMRSGNAWSWLTVPIKASGQPLIADVQIGNQRDWRKKHFQLINQAYAKARHQAEHIGWVTDLYSREWTSLNELLTYTNSYFLTALRIGTPIVYSSAMKVSGVKSELVLNLCKEVGATEYLSGPFGRDYLDLRSFDQAGIRVTFHDYKHPVYEQCQGGFEPYMAVLDLLLNCGPDSEQIFRSDEKVGIRHE
jgi:hypothetical protein